MQTGYSELARSAAHGKPQRTVTRLGFNGPEVVGCVFVLLGGTLELKHAGELSPNVSQQLEGK